MAACLEHAIGEYETAQLRLQPRAEANFNLALLYQARGDTARVEPFLRKALEQDPDFTPAVVTLGQWLESRHQPDQALQLLATQLGRAPQSVLLHFSRGWR